MTRLQSHIVNAQASKVFMNLSRHSGTYRGPHGYHKLMDAVGARGLVQPSCSSGGSLGGALCSRASPWDEIEARLKLSSHSCFTSPPSPYTLSREHSPNKSNPTQNTNSPQLYLQIVIEVHSASLLQVRTLCWGTACPTTLCGAGCGSG